MPLTTVDVDGAWSLQSKNNAQQGRLLIGALLSQGATTALTAWREGVLCAAYSGVAPSGDGRVSAGSGMTVNVNALTWVVNRPTQGPYLGWSRQLRTLGLADSDPVNPRRDLIVAEVLDSAVGDADTKARLRPITGTPAPSPTDPTVPAGCIKLARVAVGAGVSTISAANITDLRTSTSLLGAVRPMLPGDQLGDHGCAFGEMRFRPAAGGLPAMVDVWAGSDGWRGLRTIAPPPIPVPTAKAGISSHIAASYTVPDPGWPYRVVASGQLAWTQGSPTEYYLDTRLDTMTGTLIGRGTGTATAPGAPIATTGGVCLPASSDVLTGSRTVHMVLTRQSGGQFSGCDFGVTAFNRMTVQIVPA